MLYCESSFCEQSSNWDKGNDSKAQATNNSRRTRFVFVIWKKPYSLFAVEVEKTTAENASKFLQRKCFVTVTLFYSYKKRIFTQSKNAFGQQPLLHLQPKMLGDLWTSFLCVQPWTFLQVETTFVPFHFSFFNSCKTFWKHVRKAFFQQETVAMHFPSNFLNQVLTKKLFFEAGYECITPEKLPL